MKKIILRWLFGTDNIDDYFDLLVKARDHTQEQIRVLDDHIETLKRSKENIQTILKLIKICENHGIDVDTEINHFQVDNEGNVYETLD